MATHRNDYELMQAVAAQDPAAAEAVGHRLAPRLQRLCRLLLKNRADAEDAAQSSLVAIFDAAQRYEGQTTLEAWADRVCVRVALRAAQKQRRFELVSEFEGVSDPRERPSDVDFRALLQRLEEPRRTTTLLRFGLGYSIDEIADLMQTSPNTVKARLRTALERLRGVIATEVSS